MLLISSCKDCKQCNYTQYETAPVILEYFGNYKPGNYWIYENQDGTKRDSMWVSDYVEKNGGDELKCFQYPVREFVLNSNYLGTKRQLKCVIRTENKTITTFSCFDTLNRLILGAAAEANSNNILDNSIEYDYQIRSFNGLKIPKASISKSRYLNARTIFGSNIGLAQFVNANISDTFYLTKYFIK